MNITRALIGRNPCLDQAIQTRKTIVLLLFYKTITLWFPCLDGLDSHGLDSHAFLNSRNIPAVWIRPSKHGNHKVIL
jgi:hypothetical protein